MTGSLATAFRDSALGLVVAVDMVLRTSALAILFFAGSARHGVQDAVGIFLATALIFTLVGIWRIGIRTGLSIVQSEPMAVLLPAAGIIGAASLAPQVAEATSFAVIGLTAIMIGLSFWTVTAFGLERFARLMPHAVVVGFLATTGVLLIMAAFQGLAPSLWNGAAPLELDPKEAVNLGLGISVAALMWGASRVFLRYGVILVIATALGAFYGWLHVSGTTFDAAQNARLLTPSLGGTPDLLYMTHGWRDVDWGVVMATLPHMAAATLVCVLALLLTVGGIEAIIRKDVPVTRMLRTLGPLNFLAGFAGGGAGYASLASINILSMLQGRSAIAGATICLVMFIAVVQVEWIISYAPNFLTSGLLIFVGFGIIWDWLITQFRKLILTDWLIAFGIVVISIVLGILAAVAVGLTLAIMIFVVSYARLPMIRSITTLATRRSTVDRGPEQLQYLADHADHVMIMSVQGFLFFGSIDSLVGTIRDIARTNTTLQRLILDFRNVKGIDGAGLEAFRKLEFALTDSDLEIVIADASKETTIAFAHAKLGTPDDHLTILDASIDAALEHAEDAMLEASGLQADAMDARRALIAFGTSFADVDALIARMEPVSCDAGETLIRAGDAGQDIYLIDSGRLAVFTSLQGMSLMRVRALLPGTFVGEISGYLSKTRTADVVAETDSLVYRIGPEFVSSLESEAPHLAVHWHRMMAATLAERVDRTNRLLSELKL